MAASMIHQALSYIDEQVKVHGMEHVERIARDAAALYPLLRARHLAKVYRQNVARAAG